MTKGDIIRLAYEVDTEDELTSFISTFGACDAEIVAIIGAWLCNESDDCACMLTNIVKNIMGNTPTSFVLSFDENKYEKGFGSLYKNLTTQNFTNLISMIKHDILWKGGIRNCHELYMDSPRHKCKYAHEALSLILSSNTCFPHKGNMGTFYRYNLMFYWLSYKMRLWNGIDTNTALLPCNDAIFRKAKKTGVTKTLLTSNLHNTIKLTNIARNWFGDNDFYKMYEFLKYYKDYDKE